MSRCLGHETLIREFLLKRIEIPFFFGDLLLEADADLPGLTEVGGDVVVGAGAARVELPALVSARGCPSSMRRTLESDPRSRGANGEVW